MKMLTTVGAAAVMAVAVISNPAAVLTRAPYDYFTSTGIAPGVGLEILENGRRAFAQLRQARAAVRSLFASGARFSLRQAGDDLIALAEHRDARPLMQLIRIAENDLDANGAIASGMMSEIGAEATALLERADPGLRGEAQSLVATATRSVEAMDAVAAVAALERLRDLVAFGAGGSALDLARQDIASANVALGNGASPPDWNAAAEAIDSAIARLAWLNTSTGRSLLEARDLVAFAIRQGGRDDVAARYGIGQARVRLQLLPATSDLAKIAGELIEGRSLDAGKLDVLLRGIDARIRKVAEGHSNGRSPG